MVLGIRRTDCRPPLVVAWSVEVAMPDGPPPVKRALNVARFDSKFSEKTTAGSVPMPLSRTYFAAIPTWANTGIGREQSMKTPILHQRREKYANILFLPVGTATMMKSAALRS